MTAKFSFCFHVREHGVGGYGMKRTASVERTYVSEMTVCCNKRKSEFGSCLRQCRYWFTIGILTGCTQKVIDFHVMAAKNICLPSLCTVHCFDTSICHISDICEVIASDDSVRIKGSDLTLHDPHGKFRHGMNRADMNESSDMV